MCDIVGLSRGSAEFVIRLLFSSPTFASLWSRSIVRTRLLSLQPFALFGPLCHDRASKTANHCGSSIHELFRSIRGGIRESSCTAGALSILHQILFCTQSPRLYHTLECKLERVHFIANPSLLTHYISTLQHARLLPASALWYTQLQFLFNSKKKKYFYYQTI